MSNVQTTRGFNKNNFNWPGFGLVTKKWSWGYILCFNQYFWKLMIPNLVLLPVKCTFYWDCILLNILKVGKNISFDIEHFQHWSRYYFEITSKQKRHYQDNDLNNPSTTSAKTYKQKYNSRRVFSDRSITIKSSRNSRY